MIVDTELNRKARPHRKTSTAPPQVKDPHRGLSKEVNEACDRWLRAKGLGSRQWVNGGYSNKSTARA